MESFEFDESQLNDLGKIAAKLFVDEGDPRSISYKRILVRPSVNWFGFVAWTLCPAVCILAMRHVLSWFNLVLRWRVIVPGIFIYVIFTAKWAVIFLIKVYQRYAPAKIRMKCRFEPSCSEYMLLAIARYGLLKGVYCGIGRLKRCNVNNGGFDVP